MEEANKVEFVSVRNRGDRGGISLGLCPFCDKQVIGAPNPERKKMTAVCLVECIRVGWHHAYHRMCLKKIVDIKGLP
jgi:hypothetical protein